METRIVSGQTYSLAYDKENRLISGNKNSVTLASYTYDGDGRRVKAVENGLTTVYIGDYYEWRNDSTTTTQVKYYYANGQRIAMRSNGTLTWLLGDHLGSTTITAEANGTLATEQKYTAWGQTRSGSVTTDRQYTGQISEAQLGIYFYNARYYDPYLNHWTQPDTIVPDPYNPQDWDRYSYTRNNPINYVDPTGHKACSSDGDTFDTCTDPLDTPASVLAQEFGINFDGDWSESNQGSVVAAVALVSIQFGNELGLDPVSAFKQVYGLTNGKQFKFGWGSCLDCNGAGGYTYSSTHIRFETLWTRNPERRVPNVIHELGHAFNNLFWMTLSSGERVRLPDFLFSHAQTNISGFPDRDTSAPNYGYGGPFGFWQQSRDTTASEEFADNFIGWTYNYWGGGPAGEMRANWMNNFMSVAIDMASGR